VADHKEPISKDIMSRLADAGEDAIQRLAKAPGGENVLKAMNATRERIDEMQKKVRGIDDLERRVVALEKKVDALSKGGPRRTATRRTATRKPKPPVAATPPSTPAAETPTPPAPAA
jgi:hypothetical protein